MQLLTYLAYCSHTHSAWQVMPYPSTVKVDNYVHLYDSGYAGGWGWAWFNVTENFDYATGAATRGIGEHKCRVTLRSLLSGLPARLKYSVRAQTEAAATTLAATTAPATTAPATTAPATAAPAITTPTAAQAATRPVAVSVAAAPVSRPVAVSAPAVTG
jgi:hypothetical protein